MPRDIAYLSVSRKASVCHRNERQTEPAGQEVSERSTAQDASLSKLGIVKQCASHHRVPRELASARRQRLHLVDRTLEISQQVEACAIDMSRQGSDDGQIGGVTAMDHRPIHSD